MYAIFEVLAKNSYWRMLLRKATWQEAKMSLRRAHKDRRARKHLLAVSLLAIAPLFGLLYLAWLIGTGAVFFVPFVLPVLWWRARRAKQNEDLLHIAPQRKQEIRELTPGEQKTLHSYFAKLAIFYAVMLNRVTSEMFLKEKFLPEGYEVVSRRRHIDLLRQYDLWEHIAPPDRESVMAADGHWEWPRINETAICIENLRLLRWLLRIDHFLPAIGLQLRGDYGIANDLIDFPEKLFRNTSLLKKEDLQQALEVGNDYFLRCWAEGVARGYFVVKDEESVTWAKSVADRLAGDENEDLVLGSTIVSDASAEQLQWATTLSHRRVHFLKWMIAVIEEGEVPNWLISAYLEPQHSETRT
jgi:hypothetical protein